MKVKVFQNLMLAFCFVLVLSACKKPDAPVVPEPDLPIVEDPYQTITENKVLLPILIREPDMDKVIEAEKKRGGTLLEKLLPDPKKGGGYVLYRFGYEKMDVKELHYRIDPESGVLLKAIVKFPSNQTTLAKCLALSSKHGFNDEHVLAKLCSGLVRDKSTLFVIEQEKKEGEDWLEFIQYGKQPQAFPTIKEIPSEYGEMLENSLYSFTRIKQVELNAGNELKRTEEQEYGKHKGKVRYALFELNEKEAPMTHRGYFFEWQDDTPENKLGQCFEIIFIYNEPTLGYYTDDIRKASIPTKEFYSLCQRKGFEWRLRRENGIDDFYNKEKKLRIISRTPTFNDINPEKMLFTINLVRHDDADDAKVAPAMPSPILKAKMNPSTNENANQSMRLR